MIKIKEKPKIIKRTSTNKPQESGCCFTSCGGAPLIQQYQSDNSTKKILKKFEQLMSKQSIK